MTKTGKKSSRPRTELSTFLKSKRSEIKRKFKDEKSLRIRSKGLRREDVAHMTYVSLTWYTWLEQGRDISVSVRFLSRLAQVLKLSDVERRYLFRLCGHEAIRERPTLRFSEALSPQLRRLLEAIHGAAFIINIQWDVLAANRFATALFGIEIDDRVKARPNIIKLMFLNKKHRAMMPSWEQYARDAVAKFRLDMSEAGVVESEELIDELIKGSKEFELFWEDSSVASRKEEKRTFVHPEVGLLRLSYLLFDVADRPGLKLNIYIADDEESESKLRLLINSGEYSVLPQPELAEPRVSFASALQKIQEAPGSTEWE